ncbi:MAG: hypothetical protein Q9219_001009 [cf. Caloplaca sp. 3 TL-2023]
MARRTDSNGDEYTEDLGEPPETDPVNGEFNRILITAEDLEKEEQDIQELERKKQTLEERVSGPTSAVIAFKSNVEVTVVDIDHDRISAWQSDVLPIYEPGLLQIVKAVRDESLPGQNHVANRAHGESTNTLPTRPKLLFSTDLDQAIADADLIFVCVNTPTKTHGVGKGSAADLDFVEAATRTIARAARRDKIVVEKSTVPCKTAQSIREILAANAHPGVSFDVLSNPEFLAEGTAIRDLLYPDRIIIGSLLTPAGHRAATALVKVYEQWVPRERIITMNLWSSELSKLAANAMLAQRISSVNALSAICEATGADVDEVSYACGLDSRIGPHMLKAGPGFGGSCFQKDIFNIVYLSESLHLYEIADYWRSIINMNEHQKKRFTKRIISCLYNNLAGKKLAVLGFAFKKDTSDTRESPAITLVSNFVAERARVAIYDPRVPENQIWRELIDNGCNPDVLKRNVSICGSGYMACEGADAVVVATEWDEFSNKPTSTLPISSEKQLPSTSSHASRHTQSFMLPKIIGQGASSPPSSTREIATGFRIPSRKSTGVVIKDPRNGEIKTFGVHRPPSEHSSSQTLPCVTDEKEVDLNWDIEREAQRQIMFENGELAIKRRSERETRDEVEKKERIRLKLEKLDFESIPHTSIADASAPATTSVGPQLPPRWSHGLTLKDPNVLPGENVPSLRTGSGYLPLLPTNLDLQRTATTKQVLQPIPNATEAVHAVNNPTKPTSASRLDWACIASKMRRPMFVFDGRNILDHAKLEALGFHVEAIGKRGTIKRE